MPTFNVTIDGTKGCVVAESPMNAIVRAMAILQKTRAHGVTVNQGEHTWHWDELRIKNGRPVHSTTVFEGPAHSWTVYSACPGGRVDLEAKDVTEALTLALKEWGVSFCSNVRAYAQDPVAGDQKYEYVLVTLFPRFLAIPL